MASQRPDPKAEAAFYRHRSLGYQINYLARLLAQSLRARIEPLGVVPGQFPQLLALFEEDGLTQTELSERAAVDQSTMAHTLKRMERDGLVRRVQDAADRRRAKVLLTPHALELRGQLVAAATEVNALTLTGLTADETEQLLTVLEKLIANLRADPVAGQAHRRGEP